MSWMKMVASFLPWFIYPFFPPLAIVASLLVAIYYYRKSRRIFIIEWTSVLCFSLGFFLISVAKNDWYAHYESIVITSLFTVITWLSLLLKRPFTAQYAKLEVDKEHWNTFLFLRINTIMTASYGVFFLVLIILRVIRLYYPDLIPFSLAIGLLIVFKIGFVRRFPDWCKKRYFRLQKEGLL